MDQQIKHPRYGNGGQRHGKPGPSQTVGRALASVFAFCSGEYASPWAAVESIAPKIGCSPHTLHEWVKRHEVD
ncbi:MAG TPA: hypothetical protein ENO09_08805, partial [bacterium]|nr:hypothetical protein [bacterium]